MSTLIYVDIIYGVDFVQVFIKCRVDIITHFREIVYMHFMFLYQKKNSYTWFNYQQSFL